MILKFKNRNIHFTDFGGGFPVIFLHGFLENLTMWDSLIEELPNTKRFICIDLPGHGKTDNFGHIHTMEDMAEVIYFVLKHLKIKSAFVIGHSMGGYVALALAESHPEIFKGLCLMNSTFEEDGIDLKQLREEANKMAHTKFEKLVRMSFAKLFAPVSKIKFKSDYEKALNEALNVSVESYIAAQEGMKLRPNRFDVLINLNAKKLIIIGLKDVVVNGTLIKSKILETDIESVELSEGHMSHIENKSELSYFITRFIE